MKLTRLLTAILLFLAAGAHAQTAVNFNCNDCAGNNHDLFTELNSGKVIVLAWVMPCASCVGPTLTASNIVLSYASSNPGRVLMYVADDAANTNCTTLNSWLSTNGITTNAVFSNAAINMSDYGTPGMPKIVVLGGDTAHTVFFNQNGTAAGNVTALQNAIDNALAISGTNTGSAEADAAGIFPNPSSGSTTLYIRTDRSAESVVSVYDALGQKLFTAFDGTLLAGENKIIIPGELLADGIYYIRIGQGENSRMLKMMIAH